MKLKRLRNSIVEYVQCLVKGKLRCQSKLFQIFQLGMNHLKKKKKKKGESVRKGWSVSIDDDKVRRIYG